MVISRGDILQERYKIERPLGRGGASPIYLATDLESGRPVAIKVLHADSTSKMSRYAQEARLLRSLSHPNLPRVHALLENGTTQYLIMDFVPGRALDDILRNEGPLDENRVLIWAQQLCEVLEYLHQHTPPVVFRDLKPSNIMRIDGDRIKLIDFGLGKLRAGNSAQEAHAGSPDTGADIYGLGTTLFCLLTGDMPPNSADGGGRGQRTAIQRLRPEISDQSANAITSMIDPDRKRRPESVAAVRKALDFSRIKAPAETSSLSEETRPGRATGKEETVRVPPLSNVPAQQVLRTPPTSAKSASGTSAGSGTGTRKARKSTKAPPPSPFWPKALLLIAVAALGIYAFMRYQSTFTSGASGSPDVTNSASAAPAPRTFASSGPVKSSTPAGPVTSPTPPAKSVHTARPTATPAVAASTTVAVAPATPSPSASASTELMHGPRVVFATPLRTVEPRPTATRHVVRETDEFDLLDEGLGSSPNKRLIVPGRRAGILVLGANLDRYTPISPHTDSMQDGEHHVYFRHWGATLVEDDGRIHRIMLAESEEAKPHLFRTKAGLEVGGASNDVLDEFGPAQSTKQTDDGAIWSYPSLGIDFHVHDDLVTGIDLYTPAR